MESSCQESRTQITSTENWHRWRLQNCSPLPREDLAAVYQEKVRSWQDSSLILLSSLSSMKIFLKKISQSILIGQPNARQFGNRAGRHKQKKARALKETHTGMSLKQQPSGVIAKSLWPEKQEKECASDSNTRYPCAKIKTQWYRSKNKSGKWNMV